MRYGMAKKISGLPVGFQERFHLASRVRIPGTRTLRPRPAFLRVARLQGLSQDVFYSLVHKPLPPGSNPDSHPHLTRLYLRYRPAIPLTKT